MKAEKIRDAVRNCLPADSPYYGAPRGRFARSSAPRPMGERLAFALSDAKFGWNVAEVYAGGEFHLPAEVHEEVIRRAYDHLNRHLRDEDIAEAQALAHPSLRGQGDLLRALLLSGDSSIEQIAEALRVPSKAVWYFDQLFFNAKDRLDEPLYIHHLLFGAAGRSLAPPSDREPAEDPGLLLMRTGYLYGAAAVLRQADLRVDALKLSAPAPTLASFEAQILATADAAIKTGDWAHVSVSLVRSIFTAAKRGPQQPSAPARGLAQLSMGGSIMSQLMEIAGDRDPVFSARAKKFLDDEAAAQAGGSGPSPAAS